MSCAEPPGPRRKGAVASFCMSSIQQPNGLAEERALLFRETLVVCLE
jgi:hypothetical protein